MDGYSITGLALFFTTLIVLSYILLHSRRMKKDLENEELKRAVIIIRLRNIALILGMLAISSFFMLLSSMPPLNPGTAEYIARDNVSTYTLYTGLVLLAIAVCLGVVGRKAEFNFKRLLHRHGVKEKLRAMLKL